MLVKILQKTKEDILGKTEDKGPNAQELAKTLGEIKNDEDKRNKLITLPSLLKIRLIRKSC
jgi:hypothetical protein